MLLRSILCIIYLYVCLYVLVCLCGYEHMSALSAEARKELADPVGTRVTSSDEPPTEGTGADLRPSARVTSIITH